MFNSLVGTQAPTVQYWDFSRPSAGSSAYSISLEDDCAPIQYISTGGSTTNIKLYLPITPPNGKQITIINNQTGSNAQLVSIYDSCDKNSQILLNLGNAQNLTLIYISQQTGVYSGAITAYPTKWVALNGTLLGGNSVNSGSIINGDTNTIASSNYATISGGTGHTILNGSTYGTIAGGLSNTVYAAYGVVSGGRQNSVSGSYGIVVGGVFNTNNSSFAFIGTGNGNTTNNSAAVIVGGTTNTASGSEAFIGAGDSNVASGQDSVLCGGSFNTTSGGFSSIIGGTNATTRSIQGLNTINASTVGTITQGGMQSSLLNLYCKTTTATPTALTSTNGAASTTNQIILPDNSVYYYKGSVIANGQFNATTPITTTGASGTGTTATLTFAAQTASPFTVGQTITVAGVSPSGYNGTVIVTACTSSSVSYANTTTASQTVAGTIVGQGSSSAWTIEGQIKRVVGASQTFLVGTPTVTLISRDANAATWAIAVTADTTNGGLTVTATGVAGQTIQWVARINTTENTY